MLRSQKPQNPDKPQGGKHAPPPDPEDRYAPTNVLRVELVDYHGQPCTIILSKRAAISLADQLLREIPRLDEKGGAR